MAGVRFERVTQDLRQGHRDERREPHGRRRRVHRAARAVGLRQDDAAALPRRPREGRRRPHPHRRARRDRAPARAAAHRDGLPELRGVPAHDAVRQHRLRPEDAEGEQGDDQGARRLGRRARAHRGAARPLPGADLGRAAAAGGARPRDRDEGGRAADGRAALEPRRAAADGDARRAEGAAAPARHDDDLRHPRPGRGAEHGRPHRGDEGRRHRPGRHAARRLRPPGRHVRRRLRGHAADELPPRGGERERRAAGRPAERRQLPAHGRATPPRLRASSSRSASAPRRSGCTWTPPRGPCRRR